MSRTRVLVWSAVALLLFLGGSWAFWPRAILVDMTDLKIGMMEVSITEEGEARVRDLFVVSAPAAGYLNRIESDPGDCVTAGETRLADISSPAAAARDVRTQAQLRAASQAARATLQMTDADVRMRQAELDLVLADRERVRRLARTGTVSSQALERAEVSARSHLAAVAAASSAREVARFEIARAEAALIPSVDPSSDAAMTITSPVSGMVLRVMRDSEGPVAAGEPIMEIGQSSEAEVIVDVLSEDAVRVHADTRVRIRGWGGPPQWGRVDRVDPYAFTKVSALGIEEQRTNIVVRFDEAVPGLGHGYRVRADIIIWQKEAVLRIPMSALFKTENGWTVYLVEKGRAQLHPVELGQMNGQMAEVTRGLSAGDNVVEHPSSSLSGGAKVKARGGHTTGVEGPSADSSAPTLETLPFDHCDAASEIPAILNTLDPDQRAESERFQSERDQ